MSPRNPHIALSFGGAGAALMTLFSAIPATASTCTVAGPDTLIVTSRTKSIQPGSLDPAKKYCVTSPTDVYIGSGTVSANGTLDLYSRLFFDSSYIVPTNHLNSVLFMDTIIAPSSVAGTAFLRLHPLPTFNSLGATRVNLLNVEIGENRSIELTKASGTIQVQDVFIASAQPRTYQKFQISNPNLVAIGSYNIIGFPVRQTTALTLKDSSITNATLVAVEKTSTLKLDNTTIDTENVRLDGTLAGNGTFRGQAGAGSDTTFLTAAGAQFSPGMSIGTLNIQGNLSAQGATGLLSELNPNAAQKADLLAITGAFTGASNLTITLEKDSVYTATGAGEIADFIGSTYTLVTAASIDSDAIALVEGGSLNAHLSARMIGQPTASGQVVVGFTDNSATPGHIPSKLPTSTPWSAFASAIAATHSNTVVNGFAGGGTAPGGTGNSSGGQQLLSNGQIVSAAWLGLTNAQLRQLDQVHAEPFSSNMTVGLEQLEHVATSVMARMSGHNDRHAGGNAVWTDFSYIRGNVDGRNGLGSFGYSLSNVLVGADLIERESFNGGAFAGYGARQMHEHDKVNQDLSGQSALAGVYATAEIESFTFSTVAGYAHGWHTSIRNNPNVGLFTGGMARASYTSKSVFATAHLGYEIELDEMVVIEPFLAASYSRIWQHGLTETGGGDFNYRIAAANAEAITGGFGFNFSADLPKTLSDNDLMLTGFLRYDHDFEAARTKAHQITATSHLFGSFTQAGQNRGAHMVSGGLGVAGSLRENVAIRAGLTAAFSQHGHEIGGGAHIKLSF